MKPDLKEQLESVLGFTADEANEYDELGGFDTKEAIKYLKARIAEKKQLSERIKTAEEFISNRFDVRLDVVRNTIECRRKKQLENGESEYLDKNYLEFKVESLDAEFQRNNVLYPIGKLQNLLASDYVPEFDPIKSYFNNLPIWNQKTDYIKQLADFIEIVGNKDRFITQLKKHLARTVACSTIDGFYNKQCFVLIGAKQNSGKTSLIRWLVPPQLNKFYQENPELNKDGLISIAENFIINLDELDQLYRRDQKSIKSWLSKDYVKARRPYAKKEERMNRRASFFGSSNEDDFLTDETGSIRYIVFRVDDKHTDSPINFDYSKKINPADIWSQAVFLFNSKKFEHNLTKEEVRQNQALNDEFKHYTPEMELILKYFTPGNQQQHTEFLTSTEICENLLRAAEKGLNINHYNIGRALKSLNFEKLREYSPKSKRTVPGYYVIQTQPIGQEDPYNTPAVISTPEQKTKLPF